MYKILISSIASLFFYQTLTKEEPQKQPDFKTDYKKAVVNYDYFEQLVDEVKNHRAERLIGLEEFLTVAKKPNTVILDTRSHEMYDLKHVEGAIHLNFSDFTQENLDEIMNHYAGKDTRILIYCNNNFEDSSQPDFQDPAFVTKAVFPIQPNEDLDESDDDRGSILDSEQSLALNIPTYINLYGYGYKNVYELHELVDVNDERIRFSTNLVE